MRAGLLTSTIVVDRQTEPLEADGTPEDLWRRILIARAEPVSTDAKTVTTEAGVDVEREIVLRIRYRAGLEPGDRVLCDGLVYSLADIKTVVPRRVLELRCTGGVS